MTTKRPKCIILCGLPGAGKSSFVGSFELEDIVILSTDKYIENISKSSNKAYNEIFKMYYKDAEKTLNKELSDALLDNKNIIWDQTNLYTKTRKRNLSKIPKHYEKICVVFDTPFDIILSRNEIRKQNGRHLPEDVLYMMKDRFQYPYTSDGFDEIIRMNCGRQTI